MIGTNVSESTPLRGGWRKSSYSNAGGSCVEVDHRIDAILVRDSKDGRANPSVIGFARPGWSSFLTVVTGGAE